MPIQVTCQKCHKRFSVSEKFAGKQGPCPSCKTVIQVPEADEEVVIHAPEGFGPKDSEGKAVLKPIEREEVNVSTVAVVGVAAGVILALVVALALRFIYPQGDIPQSILIAGAILLAPPLVLAGYWFLQPEELEPHRGTSLAIRVVICATIYAGLWGAYALLKNFLFNGQQPEMYAFAVIGPVFLGAGGITGLATLDLEFINGALHFAFYLLVTVLLCFVMGIPAY